MEVVNWSRALADIDAGPDTSFNISARQPDCGDNVLSLGKLACYGGCANGQLDPYRTQRNTYMLASSPCHGYFGKADRAAR